MGTGNGTTHGQEGDTLNQISKQYGARVEDLLALNPGVDIYNLQGRKQFESAITADRKEKAMNEVSKGAKDLLTPTSCD